MNIDYTHVSHEELMEAFVNRLASNEQFKNISTATLYQMYMEMMTGCVDMINLYMGRTAEEMYLDTAKLDSSIIKLAKNLGYNPQRPIPAEATVSITIKGPLNPLLKAGDMIWFNNELLKLEYNGHPFTLDHCYSYELTHDDIIDGASTAWSKTIRFSVPHVYKQRWTALGIKDDGINTLNAPLTKPTIIQVESTTAQIHAVNNARKIGADYQYYDIDDLKFSNWYGIRDRYAMASTSYDPEFGWCKVGIGQTESEAFSKDHICDIELENIYCNVRVQNLNGKEGVVDKLNVCRIHSNPDKTVRIQFGDGHLVNNGFNSENETLFVKYLTTDGKAANCANVVGSKVSVNSKIYASGPSTGRSVDVTSNIIISLTSDITNGCDFESQQSMKNNAAVYFASRGQLINNKDFTSYFKSLTSPIIVKNAVAFNLYDIVNTTSGSFRARAEKVANIVYYSVINDLYESLSDNTYRPRYIYADTVNNDVNKATLFSVFAQEENSGSDVIGAISQHMVDLRIASGITSTGNSIIDSGDDPNLEEVENQKLTDTTYHCNTSVIYNDCKDKLPLGVEILSVPPIVQYYDLVGTVELDRKTNMADYQKQAEATIYKWLSDNCKFNNKIYKSDIIKQYYETPGTKRVNVDLTPSAWIKSTKQRYRYTIRTATDSAKHYSDAALAELKTVTAEIRVGADDGSLSTIRLRQYDNLNQQISVDFIKNHSMALVCWFKGGYIGEGTQNDPYVFNPVYSDVDSRICNPLNVRVDADGWICFDISTHWLKLNLGGNYDPPTSNSTGDVFISLAFTTGCEDIGGSSFYDSLITTDAISTVGGPNEAYASVYNSTVNTPVPLPYVVQTDNVIDHELTYYRYGYDNSKLNSISEKWFNLASNNRITVDNYLGQYAKYKFAIEDAILDDNNNIVNYSLPNEIAVVRLHVQYTYAS